MSDLIYRQDALKALRPIMRKSDYYYEIQKAIQDIPPAEPERKKGVWLHDNEGDPEVIKTDGYCGYCSVCKEMSEYLTAYCGSCGADMRRTWNETN